MNLPADTVDPFAALRHENKELREALAHQRQVTEQERRRALIAESSRDRAWQLAASFGGSVQRDRSGHA